MSEQLVLHAGVGGWTKCRSCNARITFARTTTGKLAPFELDARGKFVIENGEARFRGEPPADAVPTKEPRFTSHFATCPAAPTWRRSRTDG